MKRAPTRMRQPESRAVAIRATDRLHPAMAAVAVCAMTLLCGCGQEPTPREVLLPSEPLEGYAYTAVLVTRHPLWGALERLEEALEELADDEWEPVLKPRDRRFERVAFLESYALADPEERFAALRSAWRARYPAVQYDRDRLSADLLARIAWEQDRAERMVARRIAVAQATESRRLARLRTRLVQSQQERLTNLGIDTQIRDSERATAAERERQRVWEVIEAEVEAERRAGQEMLAQLEAELREEAEARLREARERADVVAAGRQTRMDRAGADLYAEMIEAAQRPWPDTGRGSASATAEADEANLRLDLSDASREQAEEARREKAELQRERLLQALGRLRAQLKSGTENAATVVAYRRGINLHLLPGGPARGENYTGLISEELEEFWRFGRDQRS